MADEPSQSNLQVPSSEQSPEVTADEEFAAPIEASEGKNTHSPEYKENINYVTPYAFGVSQSIYGVPLATPSKRLKALIIDGVFISMLTHVSYIVLFGLYAGLFLNAANHLKSQGRHSFMRKAMRGVGFFCLFIFSMGATNYLWSLSTSADEDSAGVKIEIVDSQSEGTSSTDPNNEDTKTEEKSGSDSDDSSAEGDMPDISEGLMPWLEAVLKQFGVSFGWAAFYFSVFVGWFSGQTPGKRIMGIKVIKLDGTDLTLWEAFGRYGGYGAGFATGLLGFLQVYWDPNRQAIQDKISGTLVIDKNRAPIKLEVENLS